MHAIHLKDFHLSKDWFPFSKSEVMYGCIAAIIFILSFAIILEKLF
jgi:hypothetical protein